MHSQDCLSFLAYTQNSHSLMVQGVFSLLWKLLVRVLEGSDSSRTIAASPSQDGVQDVDSTITNSVSCLVGHVREAMRSSFRE